eukprot:snap_masked-scaffold_43-processed-gene-0.33-mRNA-1 protein AED:1.00 eAED:1.00 QI:0/0/0/0/1/1/3/0/74
MQSFGNPINNQLLRLFVNGFNSPRLDVKAFIHCWLLGWLLEAYKVQETTATEYSVRAAALQLKNILHIVSFRST